MGLRKKQRVIVGMSGGVDSSVVAGLMKRRGYDVVGITLQLLPNDSPITSACCNSGAVRDAKRICAQFNIPHYTMGVRDAFNTRVIAPFIAGYASGETPNPCIQCNRHIKFTHLLDHAKTLDADWVATGHYAQIRRVQTGCSRLIAAIDSRKDQSYFLYMLEQNQLNRLQFPLGRFPKSEVRKLAVELGIKTAQKKDSQDVCFVPESGYATFLNERLNASDFAGPIQLVDGTVIGQHSGYYQFTIGQRKGLGIAWKTPLFVTKIDPKARAVIVAPRGSFPINDVQLSEFSVVDPSQSLLNQRLSVKLRYQMQPVQCEVISQTASAAVIRFSSPQEWVCPGQSAVMYQNKRVIGGGVIQTIVDTNG